MECINGIVGVTKTDCGCIVDDLDAETKVKLSKSTSGIYLDDLPGGVELRALNDIDACKTMADMALNAIENAQSTTQDDLVVALANNYQKGLTTYKGYIGQISYSSTLQAVKQYQGELLRANTGADAVAVVNRIMVIVNGSENLTLKIIRALRGAAMGEAVASYDFVSEANNYVFVPITAPLTLPLSLRGQPLDYYFVYDSHVGAGVAPKDTKIDCNCGSAGTQNAISGYLKATGVQIDDLNNLSSAQMDKYTRGVLVDVELRCNTEQLVCGSYSSQEAVAVVLARAVWYKAGELLIESVLKSNEINRYTMQGREYLWGKRNHFRSEYETRITFLASAIDVTASNCFICKDDSIYTTQSIMTDGTVSTYNEALAAIYNQGGTNTGGIIDGVIKLEE